jgi:hypothetical protein
MDDNYDTYKTANIEINQLFFLTLDLLFNFVNFILLVKYISLTTFQSWLTYRHFAPVKSFIHVSVRTDDKMYTWKTAAISFFFF